MGSSAVGDQAELRKRKAAVDAEKEQLAKKNEGGEVDEASNQEHMEYVNYFRSKYGENPRSDIFGIDGFGLFCLIYIVIVGVVLSILYFSVYARTRTIFGGASGGNSPGGSGK